MESWIKVQYDDDCTISFNDCVDIILDTNDVEYLVDKLNDFLLKKYSLRGICK